MTFFLTYFFEYIYIYIFILVFLVFTISEFVQKINIVFQVWIPALIRTYTHADNLICTAGELCSKQKSYSNKNRIQLGLKSADCYSF